MSLKLFRKANHLKQEELAGALGVSRSFISQVEAGHSKMPKSLWDKILSNTCGWETDMLEDIDEPKESTSTSREDLLKEIISEQKDEIAELNREVGRLRELLRQSQVEKGKSVSDAAEQAAHVG